MRRQVSAVIWLNEKARPAVAVMEFQELEGRAKFSTLWCLLKEIAVHTRMLLSDGPGCIKSMFCLCFKSSLCNDTGLT